MTEAKVRENRLRRMASRQGLALMRSRARDTRDLTYGTYMLVQVDTGAIRHQGNNTADRGYGLTLDDVDVILTAGWEGSQMDVYTDAIKRYVGDRNTSEVVAALERVQQKMHDELVRQAADAIHEELMDARTDDM